MCVGVGGWGYVCTCVHIYDIVCLLVVTYFFIAGYGYPMSVGDHRVGYFGTFDHAIVI